MSRGGETLRRLKNRKNFDQLCGDGTKCYM